MRPLLVFLLAAVAAAAATSRRPFDWRDCNRQACYVPQSCRDGDKGTVDTALVKLASAREVVAQRNCSFVMLIRPFTDRVWVVRLRRFQQPRLYDRRIEISRNNAPLFVCKGSRDGSVNVTGRIDSQNGDRTLLTETYGVASYSTLTELHCAFTATSTKKLETDSATAIFNVAKERGERRLGIAALGDVMHYATCDGSKVTPSSLKPAGRVDVAPVDTSGPDLACPDSTWTLMIERGGKLQAARAARCDKDLGGFKYELDFENDDLLLLDEFKALCVAPLSCQPPAHLDCRGCARVRHRPGNRNGTVPARLRCPDPGNKDKFFIANRAYVDVVPSCEKRSDGKYGWSIRDEYNKTVQFDTAACVGRVSCHDTHPIQLECGDNATCVEPLFVDFDTGEEGALCPDGLGMRFRSNASGEWADADELVCDARNGYWLAERGGNSSSTKLARNATVGCVALPDPITYWGTIAVVCLVALLYLIFLPHYLWTRKSDAEYDKNWRELSKKFRAIKTWPKSLEKSEKSQKEKSRQSEVKEVGKPIVDTRIYPDELTLKRKVTEKKKEQKKAPAPPPPRPLRKREKPDRKSAFCKSQKSAGKEAWTRWIKETGGIIQEKKPREEVLRIRAEKKAAKERKAEEKKRVEEEKKRLEEEARKPKPKPAARSVECGTDKYLMQAKVSGKDAFGPLVTPLSTTQPAVTPLKPAATGAGTGPATGKKRQYKKNSGQSKDAEIKFETPTITNDASVVQLTAPSRDKVFVTAEEPLRGSTAHSTPYSTDAKDRTRTVTDDRAVETDGSKMSKHSVLPSHVKDVAVEGTEDKTKKTKKRKGGKKKNGGDSGGGSDETPKEFTARDQEDDAPVQTAVDAERGSGGKRKTKEKSTALMTAPSPRTPITPHNTGNTATDLKRKRKKRVVAGTAEDKGPKKRSGSAAGGGGNKKAGAVGGRTTTSPKDAVKK